jgi:hypothetical protein
LLASSCANEREWLPPSVDETVAAMERVAAGEITEPELARLQICREPGAAGHRRLRRRADANRARRDAVASTVGATA